MVWLDGRNDGERKRHAPEEIVATVQLRLAAEALVGERLEAFAAADAVRMPGALENVEQELVEDGLVAAGAGVSHPADRWFAPTCGAEKKHETNKPGQMLRSWRIFKHAATTTISVYAFCTKKHANNKFASVVCSGHVTTITRNDLDDDYSRGTVRESHFTPATTLHVCRRMFVCVCAHCVHFMAACERFENDNGTYCDIADYLQHTVHT